MNTINIHSEQCCLSHGCRFYNATFCSVLNKEVVQINECGKSAVCSEYARSEAAKDKTLENLLALPPIV